ncbi:tumor necrosis factor receptor superfamily member 6B-like [Saccoglossus kowalevskii]
MRIYYLNSCIYPRRHPGLSVSRRRMRCHAICSPCADGHYMTFWNQCEQCQYCSTYCTSRYEVVENECSPTQKRTCVCKRGYYKTGDLCRPHTKCPPGSGVSRNGTSTRDVKCGKCRKGSYSDVYDSVSRCQPHTNCTAYNMVVGHPGNGTFDVTCSSNVIEVEPISDRKAKRLQKRKLREEKRNQRKMKRKDRKERRGRKRSKLASN